MGTTHATLYRFKTVYPWRAWDSGGAYSSVHVVSNTWADEPKCLLMETDNNFNNKYCSMPTPKDGQNPNISTFWECWFRFNGAQYFYFGVANQQDFRQASASIRGYAIVVDSGASQTYLVTMNGGASAIISGPYAFTPDTTIHRVRMSREVSGANRFFRYYFDDMTTPLGAAVNDVTYTNFQWWGWDLNTTARFVFGGESCQS